jgi:hypothetical protein
MQVRARGRAQPTTSPTARPNRLPRRPRVARRCGRASRGDLAQGEVVSDGSAMTAKYQANEGVQLSPFLSAWAFLWEWARHPKMVVSRRPTDSTRWREYDLVGTSM